MRTYFLLGQPSGSGTVSRYRGIYRPEPTYLEELPDTAVPNQLWLRKVDSGQGLSFDNLAEAREMKTAFSEAGQMFDLILKTDPASMPQDESGLEFLGFDIAHRSGYSLLSWNLEFEHPTPEYWHYREAPPWKPLLQLIQRYFQPRLNESGLFGQLDDAQFFLKVADTMTLGFGAVWESDGYGPFQICAVHLVSDPEGPS